MAGNWAVAAERGWGAPRHEPSGAGLVMLVEETPGLANDLCRDLEAAGYRCFQVNDPGHLAQSAGQNTPDIILLDHNGPVEQCRSLIVKLKQDSVTADIPIVVVVTNGGTTEELIAFALGADECLSRPVSAGILVARVGALLRRVQSSSRSRQEIRIGPLQVDPAARLVKVEGQSVCLTPTEFRLLWSVAVNGDRVARRDDLLRTIFGTSDRSDRRIDVHMASLRRKLGRAGAWVQTVRGVGYVCRPPRT